MSNKDDRNNIRKGARMTAVGAVSVGAGLNVRSDFFYHKMNQRLMAQDFKNTNARIRFHQLAGKTAAPDYGNMLLKKFGKHLDAANETLVHFNSSRGKNFFGYQDLTYNPVISINMKSTPIFLHELGHSQQASTMSRAHKIRIAGGKLLDKIDSAKIPNVFKSDLRAIGNTATLINEADAWKRAYKMAGRASLKKLVLKSAIHPLATYALHPVTRLGGLALITGGAVAVGVGIKKIADSSKSKVVFRRIRGRIVPVKVRG